MRIYQIKRHDFTINSKSFVSIMAIALMLVILFIYGLLVYHGNTTHFPWRFSVAFMTITVAICMTCYRLGRKKAVRRRLRYLRLKKVIAHPQARQRLPHRVIEYDELGREHRLMPKDTRDIYHEMAPGTVLVKSVPDQWKITRLRPITTPFNPIRVKSGSLSQKLRRRVEAAYPDNKPDWLTNWQKGINYPNIRMDTLFSRGGIYLYNILSILLYAMVITLYVVLPLIALYSFGYLTFDIILGLCIGIPILAGVLRLLTQLACNEWVAFPGGMALRRYRFLRGQPEICIYYARDSVLIMDFMRPGTIIKDGREQRFIFPVYQRIGILSAWLSPLPPPSEEEIRDALSAEPGPSSPGRKNVYSQADPR